MFALRYIILLLALISSVSAIALAADSEISPATLELDQLSSECLSCHEELNEPINRSHGGHVTGIPYENYTGGNQKFRMLSVLPLELVFLEGKTTCTTCHGLDPHGGQILVIDNRGNALCNSCHVI
jgi:predicted CXXCH cytochrome family protein